jgi:hypothetical protein
MKKTLLLAERVIRFQEGISLLMSRMVARAGLAEVR